MLDKSTEIKENSKKDDDKPKILWDNVIIFSIIHLLGCYGLYSATFKAKWATVIFTCVLYSWSVIGVLAGTHRMWSHRSYKATTPLKIFYAIGHIFTYQTSVYSWASDHRVHHKHVDTNADPYSIERGFFFAHMGWIIYTRHKDVTPKKKQLDLSDLLNDPIVAFEKKYHEPLAILVCVLLPGLIPWYFWNENLIHSFFVATMTRLLLTSHSILSINSFAHAFGSKPYDKNMRAVQNWWVTVVTFGEGWHNYHHVFPWDYRAQEFGHSIFDLSTAFIRLMGKIGLASDLKVASQSVIEKRMGRTGDGSTMLGYKMPSVKNNTNGKDDEEEDLPAWGWGDQNVDKDMIEIIDS